MTREGVSDMDLELAQRIASYAQTYVQRFNELCPQLAELDPPACLYTDPITAVIFLPGADPGPQGTNPTSAGIRAGAKENRWT